MKQINVADIVDISSNVRANAAEIKELASTIKDPCADIMVKEIPGEAGDVGYTVLNGHTRLNVLLDLNGTALVRVIGTNEQFHVRRDVSGGIVRV